MMRVVASEFNYRHTRRNVVYYMQGANYTHFFGRIIGIISASKNQVRVRNARRETHNES